MKLFFICPKCSKGFSYDGYWSWVLRNPFHWFGSRWTKCPYCEKTSLTTWYMITR